MGAKALLDQNPDPTRAEIAEALAWHLCRCGAHNRIMDAVALAAQRACGRSRWRDPGVPRRQPAPRPLGRV